LGGTRQQILAMMIEKGDGYVSGEEISRKLGLSRTAVWKHIEELRREGYQIEARQRSGYRLVFRPDRILQEEIACHLSTRSFGRVLRTLKTVDSTQKVAHQWAREGAPEGAAVIAEEQTAGRGRLGRSWHSPPGSGIWMSLILRPPIPIARAPQLTLMASVGIARALIDMTHLPVRIKWPNDLLIRDKKVCGILTELRGEQDRVHYAVLGAGINVNIDGEAWPPDLKGKVTSLSAEAGRAFRRSPLIAAMLKELEAIYEKYLEQGFSAVHKEWERLSGILGRPVKVRNASGEVSGIARGLNGDGALLLDTEEGLIPIYSAEIIEGCQSRSF
jgi:BirA family biotin operon repressor/biotin-[acetyl-CoA-carboxylase] ligase